MRALSTRWGARLAGGSPLGSVALLTGGAGLGAAVVVAGSPVLSRLYGPEAFGTLAVFVSLVSTLTTVGSWRYELAIPLPEQKSFAANLLALCLAIVALMGAAVSVAAFLFANPILKWLNCTALAPYFWLLPVAFIGGSAYQVLGAWTLRHEAFQEVARTRVSQSCGTVAAQLARRALDIGPAGLSDGCGCPWHRANANLLRV